MVYHTNYRIRNNGKSVHVSGDIHQWFRCVRVADTRTMV